MSWKLTLVTVLSCLVTLSCSVTNRDDEYRVDLEQGIELTLTPPPEALINRSLSQLFSVTAQGKRFEFIVQTEISSKGIVMVALTPDSLPAFEIEFTQGQPLQVRSYIQQWQQLAPYILADFQLVYWPVDRLNNNLTGSRMSQQVSPQVRILEDVSKKIIVKIEVNSDTIRFQHMNKNYSFSIEELE
ncbi:DUF3261 domain-containing protein [Thalassotalea litorea]|uniref:DUF3261 domain-containing protein n=1 Tax=Thalassotalea litorea TaxID=2020715 RepID=UPI0037370B89